MAYVRSETEKAVDMLAKPLINGMLSYASYKALAPNFDTFLINSLGYKQEMSFSTVVGAVGVASSLLAETLHNYVLPAAQSEKLAYTESMILTPVMGAVSQLGIVALLNPSAVDSIGAIKIGATGAASQIGTTYLYEGFVAPYFRPM